MLSLDYVAGLFDGEGHIGVSVGQKGTYKGYSEHYRRYQMHIGLGMTYRPMILDLHKQFGGSMSVHRMPQQHHRTCYYWKLSSDPAANFLRTLLPVLVVKLDEAKLAIQLQEHIRAFTGRLRKNPELAEDIYNFRQQLVDQLKASKRPLFPVNVDPMPTA